MDHENVKGKVYLAPVEIAPHWFHFAMDGEEESLADGSLTPPADNAIPTSAIQSPSSSIENRNDSGRKS